MSERATTGLGEEDRALLRDSLRTALARHWTPADGAAQDAAALRRIWSLLAEQGVAALGADGVGGWRDVLLAAEELGRAACAAPVAEAALLQRLAAQAGAAPLAQLAARVAAGEALVAFAFGACDGDPAAGRARHENGRLDGELAGVEGALAATHLLVAVAEAGLAILPCDAAGLTCRAEPGLGLPPLARVSLAATPAVLVPLPAGALADAARRMRLALVARALGAVRRAFELAVEHARTRRQFGQPIGRFQAIQHKLANGLVTLEATSLLLEHAARSCDAEAPQCRFDAAAAFAFASPALRQLALEVQHTLGAIGYAEEHEAPRHFRRAFADLARLGGVRTTREELATWLLHADGRPLPDFDLGARANAFRDEIRAWLARHWDARARAAERSRPFQERGVDPQFSRELGRKGWIAVSWPREYGGLGLGPIEQFVFTEEMALAGAPTGAHSCASELIGPALIAFGTPAQKAKFLPAFLRGEILFSLGYSESEAGSDLANLRLSAVRDGDGWILNGEKLWTSRGDVADYHWLAARTNPQATPPHAGISVFMVPLDAPGITIRDSMALYGHTFSAVHYDNVRVGDDARVGDVDGGWKVITHALASERVVMGAYVAAIRSLFEAIVRHAAAARQDGRAVRDDAVLRDRLGQLAAEIEAARQLAINGVRIAESGRVPVHEAAMSKVYSGELLQRLTQAAIELFGNAATLAEDAAGSIVDGRIEQQLRRSIMMVVGGGTAEVQRNLIATRGLGLPR